MRTKTLFVAAAITVAGLASSVAQSNVYSVNVVGYVNHTFASGLFDFYSNPLNNGDNRLNTILAGADVQDNTLVFKWNPHGNADAGDFDPTVATYVAGIGSWDTNLAVASGEGIFVINGGADFTHAFVGEVRQGAPTVSILGGYLVNMVASPVPVGGSITNVLALMPSTDNDVAMKWDGTADGGAGNFTGLATYSGTAPTGSWDVNLQYTVGEGILYLHSAGDTTWTRNFTVQ